MQKLATLRFALPAVVILTVAVIAFVALTVLHAHTGTAWDVPCC